jgi:hypothetical protein
MAKLITGYVLWLSKIMQVPGLLQNFTVVYNLECKCYIYIRCASFPLISI